MRAHSFYSNESVLWLVEWAAQGAGAVPVPAGRTARGTECHGAVGKVLFIHRLDLMVSGHFSNVADSVILLQLCVLPFS